MISVANLRDKARGVRYHPVVANRVERAACNTVTTSTSSPIAWEPLTPYGVAAFAGASLGRLLLVQFICALLAAGAAVWFLSDGWFPTVREAIQQLPPDGEIRAGKLDWHGDSPRLLAEGPFLAFNVDLNHAAEFRSPAHVQIEFGRDNFFVYSLLGYAEGRYPNGWVVAFNRTELAPWWGAWEPAMLAISFAAVVAGLMLIWAVLATGYFLPAWLVAYFANRDLTLCGSWRLAGAALMPGTLLMAAALVLYDFGILDLVRLAFVAGAHLLLGWIYLVVSPLFLPRIPAIAAIKGNPFRPTPTGRQKAEDAGQKSESGGQSADS